MHEDAWHGLGNENRNTSKCLLFRLDDIATSTLQIDGIDIPLEFISTGKYISKTKFNNINQWNTIKLYYVVKNTWKSQQ